MIFHEKFFQCLAGAIPLFLTPQKIGLLSVILQVNITYIYNFKFKCYVMSLGSYYFPSAIFILIKRLWVIGRTQFHIDLI